MRSTTLRRDSGFTPFGGSATKRRASEGQPAARLAVLSGAGRNNQTHQETTRIETSPLPLHEAQSGGPFIMAFCDSGGPDRTN